MQTGCRCVRYAAQTQPPLSFASAAAVLQLLRRRRAVSPRRVLCSIMSGEASSPAYTRRTRDAWPAQEMALIPVPHRPSAAETLDLILRAKVLLLQSRSGYRANTDSLTLAYYAWTCYRDAPSAVPATFLDLGAGNGLVSLLFGLRVGRRSGAMTLIELQEDLASRAERNLALNGLDRATVRRHDLASPLPLCHVGTAAIVATNPPFYEANTRAPPTSREKATAHIESSADLVAFLSAARAALRPGRESVVCMIHDARQLDRILSACKAADLCVLQVLEVMHTEARSTDRVLVKARARDADDDSIEPSPRGGSLCLHPRGCRAKRYFPDMEQFLEALPDLMFPVGRTLGATDAGRRQYVR
jgi:tRNA1(Val) A37 N6-methylase TrmN6